ncbi:MAG TPA: hypothetical protein PKG48_11955, partial [Bacteroidales bacterium]|nr:hypothetical protein [Bacteroidales bacterium]
MKNLYLFRAMTLLLLFTLLTGQTLPAQKPSPNAPGVSASLTLQPDITGKCVGDTVYVPIHITGDDVLSLQLTLDYDHNVLVPPDTSAGYANVFSGFFVSSYNYQWTNLNTSVTYPNTDYLSIDKLNFNGYNFNGQKLLDLVFIYLGGNTTIHFRHAPDATIPPLCGIWNDFGIQITPVTYTDNIFSGYPHLLVGSIGSNQTICSGIAPSLLTGIAPANGTSPTYQWQVSTNNTTFSDIPGATNLDYQPGALTATTYYRLMQNAAGTCKGPLPTNTITITVNPILPVSISIAASANPICNGSPVTFTATPVNGGGTPTYAWYRNSTSVGSNSPVYTTSTLSNGDQVKCVLTSSETCKSGSPALSNTITMTVNPILAVGVSISASANPTCAGNTVTYTATPSNGGTTPAYQWKVNAIDATNATNATFNYIPANGDVVTCVMTSSETCVSGNPATSNAVTMTVNPVLAAGVSIAASANPICTGGSVTFTATPTNGGATPAFQWMVNAINATDATNSSFSYSPVDGDAVTCVLTSSETCVSGSPATSNTVLMTVHPNLAVGSVSAGQSICTGTAPALLTGTPPSNGTSPVYQWQSSPDNVTFTDIPGATDLTYLPGTLTATTYFRQIQNAAGTCGGPLPTPSVTITVTPLIPVSVVIYSTLTEVCANTPVAFLASPTNGGTTPAYQWKVNGNNVGTNFYMYTYEPQNNDVISCVLTSSALCVSGNPATSNLITMTVDPDLVPGTIANDQSVCSGATPVLLTSTLPNGTSPTYQWQVSTDNTIFTDIPGATDATWQPGPLTATTYYRQMQNATATCGGPLPTNTVTILVTDNLPVNVTITADANPVCAGTPVTFTANPINGGTLPAYQWQVNAANAVNATNATYTYVPENSDVVTCVLTSSETCVTGSPATSNIITMTVNPILAAGVTINASTTHVCVGSPVTFTATPANGGATPAYQWQVNAANATNATNDTYTYVPANGDVVTCVMTSSETCVSGSPATSNSITITADPDLIPGTVAASQTICTGSIPALLTSTPPNGTSPTYQWQVSADNVIFTDIPGATDATWQPGTLTATTYYRQMQNATGTCG